MMRAMKRKRIPMALQFLLLLGVIAFLFTASRLTRHSYLRPAVLDAMNVFMAVMWFVILAVACPRLPVPRGPAVPMRERIRHTIGLLVMATAFAPAAGAIVGLSLLLGVRYGPSDTVEFQARVTNTWRAKNCPYNLSFDNPPLGRETRMCADHIPLLGAGIGDVVNVREELGPFGGTIVTLKKDWSAGR